MKNTIQDTRIDFLKAFRLNSLISSERSRDLDFCQESRSQHPEAQQVNPKLHDELLLPSLSRSIQFTERGFSQVVSERVFSIAQTI